MCLHNLNAVVDRLVPPMMHMPLGGGDWQRSAFPDGDPVIEIVGGRATGKTALLQALRAGYGSLVPTAFIELDQSPYSAPDPEDRELLDTAISSPVTNILFTLRHELEDVPTDYRPKPKFLRLSPALLVISAWRPDAPEQVRPGDREEAENELRDLLGQQHAPAAARSEAVRKWQTAVSGVIGGLLPQVPGLAGVLDAALETLTEGREGRAPLSWWRDRLGRDDPVKGLFGLVRKFRQGDADRAEVESHLIGALLADIADAYGSWARRTAHPPLILLDDVDAALGERFLEPFVEQYGQHEERRRWSGRPMRPVVIATSRERGAAADDNNGAEDNNNGGDNSNGGGGTRDSALKPVTQPAPWNKRELCPPATWLLRLRIPAVTADEIRDMLEDCPCPPGLPQVIARLSGGRTGNALLLVEAARQRLREGGEFDTLDLLALPVRAQGDRPVADLLLEQLLPDATVREQLLDLAPALDEAAAASLAHRLPTRPEGTAASLHVHQLVADALSRVLWNECPWPAVDGPAPLITDRGLRTVLLHTLREEPDGQRWSMHHRRLADHYNQRDLPADSVAHELRHLHHALALGQLDTLVVRALHRRYLDDEPDTWLRTVNFLAAAPRPRGGFPSYGANQTQQQDHPDAPGAPPPCPACAHDGAPKVHSAIRQVLTTVWRLSDPSAQKPVKHGDPALVQLKSGLMTLSADYEAREHLDAGERWTHHAYVGALAKDGWIDAFLEGRQAPELPVS
ncbi:hypothetical protein G5C60_37125 [Streptomyces sp. HC44]|uniref:Uncharacterized protein n=1 Tax=Streptomyces scabichelini TaxID=2711217 RepID=A0A6G4VH13_9ACTN|nr:hypothetical protein [Streptomyces scabichelini]NGO13077.1 hypothetical protein [Streptomyces scabichelini]